MPQFNLKRSLFFPACGLDFEPLLRFSNLCDTFVYADWNLAPGEVETAVRNLGCGLRLEGEPRVVQREELGGNAAFPMGFRLSADESGSYQRRMHEVSAPRDPWAREFRLCRCFGDVTRELTLIYVAAEGLATYTAMYGQHNIAPVAVCTIQSGGNGWTRLEQPGGAMERLIETYEERPRLWIRGSWVNPYFGPHRGRSSWLRYIEQVAGECQPDAYAALEDDDEPEGGEPGHWTQSVQNYAGWITGQNFAVAEAFARDGSDLSLQRTIELNGDRRVGRLELHAWTTDKIEDFDGCFLTPGVADELQVRDLPNVRVWESASSSIVDFLNWIETECEQQGWKRVAAVPVVYEDEGEHLRQWVRRDGLPRLLEIHFVNQLDFADLRGWPAASDDA